MTNMELRKELDDNISQLASASRIIGYYNATKKNAEEYVALKENCWEQIDAIFDIIFERLGNER